MERRTPDQQAHADADLNTAPRHALVIGNSGYASVTPLKNPANDAKAIAEQLRPCGFVVELKQDLTREAMLEAITAYAAHIATNKAVGLFYFAGHGLQLSWRNFLVPVDAMIEGIEDIPNHCVDLGMVIEGITKANNPMNVVVLDACRNNPFSDLKLEAKGLSQIDAPPGTLLAFATSPGNVASDGEGANGLYTENLLREMRVLDAKIEDVFKRVRLHVRLTSHGQQIPWESTSLEEDFYFVLPQALATQALEEAERERKQEAAMMEKLRAEEQAERRRREEQAAHEARLEAEAAERKRQQELALLEQQRISDETKRKYEQELALQEAKRVAEKAERARREEQALREAKLAEEEAAQKFRKELALLEKQRQDEEVERKRREQQALTAARAAEAEAARKREQEAAFKEQQRAKEEAERRRKQNPAPIVFVKPSAEELNRRYEEELAIWEKIKQVQVSGPLEDYLQRFPSGYFSELAQLRLDQVLAAQGEKKIKIDTSATPFSQGTGIADIAFKVGDTYTYQIVDLLTRVVGSRVTDTITRITDTAVFYDNGSVSDLLGNPIRTRDGRQFSAQQNRATEYRVGKKWTSRTRFTTAQGQSGHVTIDFLVVAREKITVPAGTFNAFRVDGVGIANVPPNMIDTKQTYWIAPDQVRHVIASEDFRRSNGRFIIASERYELVSFKQS